MTRYYGGPMQLTDGSTLYITGKVDTGYVYADNGTAIEADRSRGPLSAVRIDRDGNVVGTYNMAQLEQMGLNGASAFNNIADCHGVTFAEGQLWINNDQVPALMTGDGYVNVKGATKIGDVGVYSTDGQLNHFSVQHSVRVTQVDPTTGNVREVRSKGGITPLTYARPEPGQGTAWHEGSHQLNYYRKDPLLSATMKSIGQMKDTIKNSKNY